MPTVLTTCSHPKFLKKVVISFAQNYSWFADMFTKTTQHRSNGLLTSQFLHLKRQRQIHILNLASQRALKMTLHARLLGRINTHWHSSIKTVIFWKWTKNAWALKIKNWLQMFQQVGSFHTTWFRGFWNSSLQFVPPCYHRMFKEESPTFAHWMKRTCQMQRMLWGHWSQWRMPPGWCVKSVKQLFYCSSDHATSPKHDRHHQRLKPDS